jgi:hypothetical protein
MAVVRFFAIMAAVLLVALGGAQAAEQTVTIAGLKVTVWSQPAAADFKQPVIIFSHGFHGCATQSRPDAGVCRERLLGVRARSSRCRLRRRRRELA